MISPRYFSNSPKSKNLVLLGDFNMDWQLLLKYTEVLAWPILGLYLIRIFREEIRNLLNRIKSAQFPGGTRVDLLPRQEELSKEIPPEIRESAEKKEGEIRKARDTTSAENLSVEDLQQQVDVLLSELAELRTALDFERIYQYIFGSQIALLDVLRANGGAGILYEEIAAYYQRVRAKWPALKYYTLEKYLSYLLGPSLVQYHLEERKRKYTITPYGIDFLEYIEKLRYSKEKNF